MNFKKYDFVKSAKKQERIRILIKIVKRIQRRILVIPFSNYAKPVKESYGFQQHAQQTETGAFCRNLTDEIKTV